MKTRSITQKFGIWLVLVTLFVMIVFGVINYFLFINQLDKDLDVRLNESSLRVIDLLALHVWNLDNQRVQEVAQEQAFLESFARLRVLDSFGDSIYEAEQPTEDGELVFIERDIIYAGNVAGSIEVAFSTENIMVAKNAVIRSTLVIIFAVALTVLVLTFFIVRSISRPIVSLTKTAEEIAGGNLNKKVEVKSKDEVGQLGDAFNVMTSKLKESYEGLEEKVKQRTFQLSKSNKLKDLFMDIMRHDLLNPAGVVRTNSQLVLSEEKDAKKKKSLEIIERNSNRMIRMIENASILAKLESGEKIDFKEEDLGVMLKASVEELSEGAKEKNMIMKVYAEGKFPAVVNPLIQNVFSNFINNAIKYSPEKTEIIAGIKDKDDSWLVYVEDRGEGIPAKYKKAIFERFTRLEKSAIKGSGLGLAISKKITEAHNGKIWVRDHKGGGSVFYVLIPKIHKEEVISKKPIIKNKEDKNE